MYGLWSSPITPRSLAASMRLSEPHWDTDGPTLGWVEGRSDRGVLVVQEDGGAPRDLTPGDLSVRAFVGYGGGDFTLAHGAAYFVAQHDQRIYRQELAGGSPRPITPAFGAASTPRVSPDGRWLLYVHTYEDVDALVVVDTAGKHWPTKLATGSDFYMQPAWHPEGDQIAWIEWDHPNMPWDGTRLKLAHLAFPEGGLPVVISATVEAGGPDTAIYQPEFTPDAVSLLYVSDHSGWGHVYRRHLVSGEVRELTEGDSDFGEPAWSQGQYRVAALPGGAAIAVRSKDAFDSLTLIHSTGDLTDLSSRHAGYTSITQPAVSPDGTRLAFIGSGGQQPPRVVVMELHQRPPVATVIRRSDPEITPRDVLSEPRAISWPSFDGEPAHGLYYAPANGSFVGTGAPPLVVLVHGGPTSQARAAWSAQVQFLTSRGYAVLYPNYRGSTGYGRDYMLKLRESWGIFDVEDSRAGAEYLVREGLADGSRLVIMGGSAGGFTVLLSLVRFQGFYRAGVSMFGVSNQFTLAADTHKFEARYLDTMLGPLPEAAAVYRERSPIFSANAISDPVALFQGDIDRVVPREQSDSITASLRARGIPHEYHVYEGEGHGWRKAETIEKFYTSLDRFLRQYVLFA